MWRAAPVSGLVLDSENEFPEVLCIPTRMADYWKRQRQGRTGSCACRWWAPPAARWRQAGGGSKAGAGAATGH